MVPHVAFAGEALSSVSVVSAVSVSAVEFTVVSRLRSWLSRRCHAGGNALFLGLAGVCSSLPWCSVRDRCTPLTAQVFEPGLFTVLTSGWYDDFIPDLQADDCSLVGGGHRQAGDAACWCCSCSESRGRVLGSRSWLMLRCSCHANADRGGCRLSEGTTRRPSGARRARM